MSLGKTLSELRASMSADDIPLFLAFCQLHGSPAQRIEHAAVLGLTYTAAGLCGSSITPDRIAWPEDRPPMTPGQIKAMLDGLASGPNPHH